MVYKCYKASVDRLWRLAHPQLHPCILVLMRFYQRRKLLLVAFGGLYLQNQFRAFGVMFVQFAPASAPCAAPNLARRGYCDCCIGGLLHQAESAGQQQRLVVTSTGLGSSSQPLAGQAALARIYAVTDGAPAPSPYQGCGSPVPP
jgi:hypothetical protein